MTKVVEAEPINARRLQCRAPWPAKVDGLICVHSTGENESGRSLGLQAIKQLCAALFQQLQGRGGEQDRASFVVFGLGQMHASKALIWCRVNVLPAHAHDLALAHASGNCQKHNQIEVDVRGVFACVQQSLPLCIGQIAGAFVFDFGALDILDW